MRSPAWPLIAVLCLVANACSDGQIAQSTDAGRDGDASGAAGSGGGGSAGGATAGTGGSAAGTGGSAAGTGGSAAGAGGSAAGTGGSAAGTGGATAGSGGANAGSGGSAAGSGGANAGSGGSAGGATAGTGGNTAGSGGSGVGGATAGTGGNTAGSGGATAGSGGSAAGAGGSAAGSGGSAAGAGGNTGGSLAGTGGSTAGGSGGSGGAAAGAGGSSAGSGGSTAGSGGSAGTGGGGGTVACTSASTCPGGPDGPCQRKTCDNNFCGLELTAAGTALATQTPGDCHRKVCDGVGNEMEAIFDGDPPADDGNACTDETCVSGLPSHPPEPARTACTGPGGAMLCNGSSSAPACVVCVAASDCPGTDSICQQRVCGNQNTCGFSNATAGTAAEPDATGNCQKAVCNSTGGVTSTADNNDVPMDDGNPCTSEVCTSGAPEHPAKQDGTACTAAGGGTVCASGACVQCLTADNCPGSDTLCRQRTCATDHTCGAMNAPAGTAAEPDNVPNCQKAVCNGSGGVTSAVDNTDKPDDGDPCTKDICTNGTPSNPDLPAGALCASDGSKACDAAGACNTLTFRVVRVGTGTGSLSSNSAAVFVEERRIDGSLVGTVPLPTTAALPQRPLTMSGSATSEGALSLSSDGRYLALAGYATGEGTPSVASTLSATTNRVVGRIDVSGTVNTTTAFPMASNANNIRGAVTTDGGEVWIAGGSGSGNSSGGVWYNQTGATTNETHTLLMPDSVRALAIFGDQLYGSSGNSPYIFRIGFGTPTSGSQSAPAVPGLPSTTGSTNPYQFALVDASVGVPGVDTLYVAEDTLGLKKYTFNGTSWTAAPAALNIAGNAGFRGVAAYAVGSTVTLMASTADPASASRLVVFVDTGSGTATGTVVATAPANTVFRGVAVSPHFQAP